MAYYVYRITHRASGKLYFGITKNDPGRRLRQHYNDKRGGRVVTRAMRKHGLQAFKIEVVEEHPTEAMAREREIFFIAAYDTTSRSKGYNVSPGGDYDCRWWDYASDEQKQSVRENSSKVIQAWWDSQSEAQKLARGDIIRQHIASLPDAERERRFASARSNGAAYWENISEDELAEFRATMSGVHKRRWAKATAQERAAFGKRISDAWTALPQEKRAEIASRRAANRKTNFQALPQAEQKAIRAKESAATKRQWAEQHPAKRNARIAKRRATIMAKAPEERAASNSLGWSQMSADKRAARVRNVGKGQKAFMDANPDKANAKAALMRKARMAKIAEQDKNLSPKEKREKEMARARSRKYAAKKRAERKRLSETV